jgi:hypothetical protein
LPRRQGHQLHAAYKHEGEPETATAVYGLNHSPSGLVNPFYKFLKCNMAFIILSRTYFKNLVTNGQGDFFPNTTSGHYAPLKVAIAIEKRASRFLTIK